MPKKLAFERDIMVTRFQRVKVPYGSLLKKIYNYCTSARVVRERNFLIFVFRWLAVYGEEHSCTCKQCVEGHDFQELIERLRFNS